jgi:hypothetical protein
MLMDAILQYCRPQAVPRCFLDRCDGSGIEEVSGYPWGEHDSVLVSPRPTLRMGRLTHLRYTHRERRHLARHGRRWPIRVPAYRQHVSLVTQPTATEAHRLAGTVDGVWSTHAQRGARGDEYVVMLTPRVAAHLLDAGAVAPVQEAARHSPWATVLKNHVHQHGGSPIVARPNRASTIADTSAGVSRLP